MNNNSIFPFTVMAVGDNWYVCKPNGERIDIYFRCAKSAFKVAETLKEVYWDA
jgi:hypothetical protein